MATLDLNSFPWPPPDEPRRAPYRGLRPLEEQDAAIYFGRESAIEHALERIRALAEGGVERMRLAGYADTTTEIDVCAGVN